MAQDLELSLKIRALVEGVRNVQGLTGEVQRLSAAGNRRIADPTTLLRAGAQRTRNVLSGLRRNVLSLRGALAGLGVGLLARSFIGVGREVENIGVRMRFLTRNAAEAAEATEALRGFAAQVPFELREISAAAPVLLTVADGASELNRLLEITGDIAAATGLSFEVTAQQIQRAFSSGINSADLFRERGVRAMLGFEAGVNISAEQTRRHIFDLWFGPGGATNSLKGASAAMAQTWDGTVSMLQDKWFSFRAALVNAAPFEFLKASMQELDTNLGARFGSIEQAGAQAGEAIVESMQRAMITAAAAADAVRAPLTVVIGLIEGVWETFRSLPGEIQAAGLFAALLFGRKGVVAFGAILALHRDTIHRAQELVELARNQFSGPGPAIASGVIEGREGLVPTLSDDDVDTFEGRVRRIIAAINARIEAARNAREEDAAGGGGGGGGAPPRAAPDPEAEQRADAIAKIIAALRDQAATEGQTAEQVALYRLAQLGADEATLARARGLIQSIQLTRDEAQAMEASRAAAERQAEAIHAARMADQELLVELAEEIRLLQFGARERAQEEATRRLSAQATDEQREAVRALAGALHDLTEAARENADEMSAFAEQAARNMQDAFAQFLFDPFQGGLDGMLLGLVDTLRRMASEAIAARVFEALGAEDALKGILGAGDDAAAAAAQQAAAAAAAATLTGGGTAAGGAITTGATTGAGTLAAGGKATAAAIIAGAKTAAGILSSAGAAGGAAGGGGSAGIGSLFNILSGLFHTGGIAGQASQHRELSALAFMGAPRFHGGGIAGLGADEMPAILRRDEEVLTRDDPRHRFNLGGGSEPPPMNFKFINAFDGQTVRDEMSSAAGERVILNVVSRNKRLLGIG